MDEKSRPKVRLVVEGDDPQELRKAVMEFLNIEPGAGPLEKAWTPTPTGWSPEEVERLWLLLQPDARQILAEIAKQPEGYPMGQLQEILGWDGKDIGGRLSSVGHNLKRFPGKPNPVSRDYTRRLYMTHGRVAEIIRRLAEGGGGAGDE